MFFFGLSFADMNQNTSYTPILFVLPVLAVIVVVFIVNIDREPRDTTELLITQNQTAESAFVAPNSTSDSFEDIFLEFEGTLSDGSTFLLSNQRGNVVLINFWATWCAPCRVEIPDLIALQDEFGDAGLHVVGISLDLDGFDVVRPFSEEFGINYDMLVDDGSIAESIGGIYALPTSVIVDKQGHIREFIPGLISKDLILPLLESLMTVE